jgi:predicted nuclease of predicted toxin-antitoxin system
LRLIVSPQRRVDARLAAAPSRRDVAQQRRAAARARDAHVWRVARAFEAVCADLDSDLNQKLVEISENPTVDDASRTEAANAAAADIQRTRALARTAALAHLNGDS